MGGPGSDLLRCFGQKEGQITQVSVLRQNKEASQNEQTQEGPHLQPKDICQAGTPKSLC